MREILFRGKRLDNGEWVEGWYQPETTIRHWDGRQETVGVTIAYKVEEGFLEDTPVDPATIGQYTGLKDKNGKRIWEGDILHIAKIYDGLCGYYKHPLDYPVNVVVKWDLCAWMWETLCDDKRYITFPDAWCHYECEVIGNVHDNPELLEK